MKSRRTYYHQQIAIAKNWAMRKVAGFDDSHHRDILLEFGATEKDGRLSATTLTDHGCRAVLAHYGRMGFGRSRPSMNPQQVLILSLWGQLGDAQKVEQASRPALMAWLSRQLGKDIRRLEDITPRECSNIIEQLKAWLERA